MAGRGTIANYTHAKLKKVITDTAAASGHIGSSDFTVSDNKKVFFGDDSDYYLVYDETTSDAFALVAGVEAASFKFNWAADQADDDADSWQWNIADGGTMTLKSAIGGSFATHVTFTPNSTAASSGVTFAGTATAVAFETSSDRTLKKNITQLNNAMETVTALRGVNFEWKANDKYDIGFIAQEVQEILPEAVGLSAAGTLTVGYGKVSALLVEAFKEQQEEIKQLKSQVGQIDELKQMVLALMNK